MELFFKIFKSGMKTPKLFGVFHLAFFVFFICLGVWLCKKYPKADEKSVRKILFFFSSFVLILELFKQLYYGFSYLNGKVIFSYNWYFFPFQFCSTPMYAGLLGATVKNKKVYRALCCFLATFALFAGGCVMVYPRDVLTNNFFINIQTFCCHGSMVAVGIFLLCRYAHSNFKTVLRALPVFLCFVSLAVILNETAFRFGIRNFNMFFISPHCKPYLPVFSRVQNVIPFPLDILIYIVGFTLLAYGVILISAAIKNLSKKQKYVIMFV